MKLFDEIKNINSDRKSLKEFGIVMAIAFAILTVFLSWHHHRLIMWSGCFSVFFLSTGFMVPLILWPLHKVWMTLALLMGCVMSHVILCLLYFFVLTPISFILRVTRKKFFAKKGSSGVKSYWQGRHPEKRLNPKQYELQY